MRTTCCSRRVVLGPKTKLRPWGRAQDALDWALSDAPTKRKVPMNSERVYQLMILRSCSPCISNSDGGYRYLVRAFTVTSWGQPKASCHMPHHGNENEMLHDFDATLENSNYILVLRARNVTVSWSSMWKAHPGMTACDCQHDPRS